MNCFIRFLLAPLFLVFAVGLTGCGDAETGTEPGLEGPIEAPTEPGLEGPVETEPEVGAETEPEVGVEGEE